MEEQHESVGALVRKAEDLFIRGNTQISKYVSFSMHDTLERIEAYANSRHISGDTDTLGRDKPFFNITTAAINIWYRATDIDRKNIKFDATTNKSVVLAFVANVMLQNWMIENRWGQFLNDWGRSLAKYGSTVLKFVDNKQGLHSSVIPWNRIICDAVDFEANPKIEILELTEAQLRGRIKTNNYDADQVEALCASLKARETLDKKKKDNKNDYIKLYEVHGELPRALLKKEEATDADWDDYVQQMHVISTVGIRSGRTTEYTDFTLFAGEEAKDPYMITHLIKEDSRSLGIGAVEHLFEAQWMMNHSMKQIKDTLDISSRLILQTADVQFVGRNILSDFETGDIFNHAVGMPLTKVDTAKPDIVSWQNYAVQWHTLSQEITATPDSMRGTTPVSGTPYATTALLAGQSNSLFALMTQNKGLHIEDILREFVIPHIKKQLKHKDQIVAILDDAGIQQIDLMYVPNEAIKRYNAQAKQDILAGNVPSPYQPVKAQQQVMQGQAAQGNQRFFVPDEADQKTWDQLFSDFEWDAVRVEVTNEQMDKQATLQVLSSIMQTIASNPMILNNPNAMQLFSAIMRETGAISPIQLSTNGILPPMLPAKIDMRDTMDFKDMPPEAQQQLLERQGIHLDQPPTPPQPVAQPAPAPAALLGK